MITAQVCYHCGYDFIAKGNELLVDTWICQNCIQKLIDENIIVDARLDL
jgi:hypothetical protein